ncbi:MAG: DUF120 domain-containing protein [Halobacteriaceae archaeon]
MQQTVADVGFDELGALRALALEGALEGDVRITCTMLADQLETSNQTASRRLRTLEETGLIERSHSGDGQWITILSAGRKALEREYETYRRIFEDEEELVLSGTVTSGMGEGKHYISLEGYKEQFISKLGYEPFLGTLNIDLEDESTRRRGALEAITGTRIDQWEGEDRTYGAATCYSARLSAATGSESEAHIIVPDRTHHDEGQLELIAPVKLRDALSLDDGDRVSIYVKE